MAAASNPGGASAATARARRPPGRLPRTPRNGLDSPAASGDAPSAVGRLDRYLLREILLPFAFSVAFVVIVVFLFQIRRLAGAALGFGLEPLDVLVIFVAALPPFLVLSVPIAFLLSVLVGLGRLGGDLELVAARAAGAGPWRLARVPAGLGVLVSLACLPIAFWGEPAGLDLLHERLIEVGLRNLTAALRPGVFNERFRGLALYAGGADRRGALSDVLLFDEREPERPVLVLAREGRLRPGEAHDVHLELIDGRMHLGLAGPEGRYDRVRFERAALGIDAERELRERTRFVSEINRLSSAAMWARAVELGPSSRLGRRIEKTWWRRLAFPSMALVFAIVGAAIGIGVDRRQRARAALLAMGAVVGYYVLTRVGDWAVVQYPGTPFLAAFGPNLLLLGLGALGLGRAGRAR